MALHSPTAICQNPQCTQRRGFLRKRLRQPKGIRFNKKWYCGPGCFEQGAALEFSKYDIKGERSRPGRYRVPLGLLMLSKGLISSEGMQEALKAQRESQNGRFGEWLMQLGAVTEAQLTAALGMQWGCPVFRLGEDPDFESCADMVPLGILEYSRMAPVHFMPASRMLYVAFSDGIDFQTLQAIESMLDCSTQPCVISEREMAAAHDAIRRLGRPSETVLECPRDPRDLAREVCGWVESNQAEHVCAAACPGCVWVRIESRATLGHLLFRYAENRRRDCRAAGQ